MGIHVGIEHRTTYRFDRATSLHPHVIRLRPTPHCRTPILSYSLRVEPSDHFVNWQQDPFGNFVARLVFPERTRKFSVEVDLIADMVTRLTAAMTPRWSMTSRPTSSLMPWPS